MVRKALVVKVSMKKRVFISFAIEDSTFRDFLVGQARNAKSPFNFIDRSVYKPWDSSWKTNCRAKIKGCDGIIAIITKNTINADGQLWEINCAIEEEIPIRFIKECDYLPSQRVLKAIGNRRIYNWTWNNISNFLNSL